MVTTEKGRGTFWELHQRTCLPLGCTCSWGGGNSQLQTLLLRKAWLGQGYRFSLELLFSLVRRWWLRSGHMEGVCWMCVHMEEEEWPVECLWCPSVPPSPGQHKFSVRAISRPLTSPGPLTHLSPNTVTLNSVSEAHKYPLPAQPPT